MRENIFLSQPEFIDEDPRVNCPTDRGLGYKVDPSFMLNRHSILLPRNIIDGKKILDLGSCNGATGAWCLSNGAKFYRGVELQKDFVESSRKWLGKYYPDDRWHIQQDSIEDFLTTTHEKYDVVHAGGILYGLADQARILGAMANISDVLVIESSHPRMFYDNNFLKPETKKSILKSGEYARFIENTPFISLGRQGMLVPDEKTMFFLGTKPSMGAVKFILHNAGFRYIDEMNQRVKKSMPSLYSPTGRFALLFVRETDKEAHELGFSPAYSGQAQQRLIDWDEE